MCVFALQNMFVVDPNTGLVTVNQPLNYDRVATWQATVQAVDTNLQSGNTGTGKSYTVNGQQCGSEYSIIAILVDALTLAYLLTYCFMYIN